MSAQELTPQEIRDASVYAYVARYRRRVSNEVALQIWGEPGADVVLSAEDPIVLTPAEARNIARHLIGAADVAEGGAR